jgi:hypothetical protein
MAGNMANLPSPAMGLSPRAEKVVRNLSTSAVIALALGGAILSYSGLYQLAVNNGFDPRVAWLMPLVIDGMVLTGSLGAVASSLAGLRAFYPWMLTYLGVIISVWGNVAAADPNPTAQLVHAIPPITFALSVEGLLRIYRAGAVSTHQREVEAAQAELRRLEREERAAERAARQQLAQTLAPRPAPRPAPAIAPQATGVNVESGELVMPQHPLVDGSASADPAPTAPGGTARERIQRYLQAHPNASGGEVARALQTDPSYTRKLVKAIRGEAAATP